ncbi:hypothetical protein CDIK_0153 [Cucumispora dikerogammari]|nr:hypothetical protein CDIK_0153 [Cucumispora dikerogammari]
MIRKQIQTTISALKCYTESLTVTHLLFCNLSSLLTKEPTFTAIETNDDWKRLILLCALNYTSPSYKSTLRRYLQHKKLDTQLLKYLKENKSSSSKLHKYKLTIIFYYIQANLDVCSKFLIFEMLNYPSNEYMKCKIFVDCLLIGGDRFNIGFADLFIKNMMENCENQRVLIKLIPGLLESNIFSINYAGESEVFICKYLESLVYYAKYTKNIHLFKRVMVEKDIRTKFKEFVECEWGFDDLCLDLDYAAVKKLTEGSHRGNIERILREEYELAVNKKAFITQLETFINEIKCSFEY